ncbi:MFS transporter, partial [Enterobacter hormaechei]
NAELGFLMTAYGLVNFLLYLPGGWAADRFSARKLMTFSLISTGISGFYYATFPSYTMICLLHALWAVTTVFTFWAVCVRIIRTLGTSE